MMISRKVRVLTQDYAVRPSVFRRISIAAFDTPKSAASSGQSTQERTQWLSRCFCSIAETSALNPPHPRLPPQPQSLQQSRQRPHANIRPLGRTPRPRVTAPRLHPPKPVPPRGERPRVHHPPPPHPHPHPP